MKCVQKVVDFLLFLDLIIKIKKRSLLKDVNRKDIVMNATRLLERLEASRETTKVYPFILSSMGDSTLFTFFSISNPTSRQIAERIMVWNKILEPIHKEVVKRLKKDIRAGRV